MQDKHADSTKTKWLPPVIVGVAIFVLILVLVRGLYQREATNMRSIVRAEASKLMTYIQTDFFYRVPSLQRMSAHWAMNDAVTEKKFALYAHNYIYHLPGIRAIEWVNPDFTVKWVVPLTNNETELNVALAADKNRRPAMERAKTQKITTMSPMFNLHKDTKAFILYTPVQKDTFFTGLIGTIIEVKPWFDHLLTSRESQFAKSSFRASIEIEDMPAYEQSGYQKQTATSFKASADKRILGKMFTVSVEPTKEFVKENATRLPQLTLIFGAIFSLLASLTIFLMQRTSQQKRNLLIIKRSLETEIEQRKVIEAKLSETSSSLSLAIDAGQIGVWSWDLKTDALTWNDFMYRFYGVEPDTELSYNTWKNALVPEDAEQTEQMLRGALKGINTFDTEFRIKTPTGVIRYIQAAAILENDKDGNPIRMLGVNTDITDRKKAEETIRHMANYDNLTDLPTRRLATDRMKVAIKAAQRHNKQVAVLFMDLDGFKPINDAYGHKAGDAALQQVAKRLLECVRKSDTVARIGGDEFLIILSEVTSKEGVTHVAKKIIQSISQPMSFKDDTFSMGVSIGISIFPDNSAETDHLITLADKAMYVSKNGGKNRYTFASESNQ